MYLVGFIIRLSSPITKRVVQFSHFSVTPPTVHTNTSLITVSEAAFKQKSEAMAQYVESSHRARPDLSFSDTALSSATIRSANADIW